MSTVIARPERRALARAAWPDRLLTGLPVTILFLWLSLLYAALAWANVTAWFFYDELEYAELSRSFAETGSFELRGEPQSFTTLYSILIAPAWWIDDAERAYQAAKFLSVLTMSAVVFPAYGLARVLVSRPPALFAAAGSALIPSMAYSSFLLTEVLAYPFAALCLFLTMKALVTKRPAWFAGAIAACAVAPLVRAQLVVVPAASALAAFLFAASSEETRKRLSARKWAYPLIGVLLAGVVLAADELIGRTWEIWTIVTRNYPERMLEYGLWALGALAIGVGFLPAIAALASLVRGKGEPRSSAHRAFVVLFVAYVVSFTVYAGVKAAFLSTFWQTLVQERNVIYLSPLLFVGTAVWLERPRVRPAVLAASAALVAYVVIEVPLKLDYPYIEALGFSLPAWAYVERGLSTGAIEWVLVAGVAVSALAILGVRLVRPARLARWGVVGLAALVLAWNLAGELAAGDASRGFAREELYAGMPKPLDWVDRSTGGGGVLYLGQEITNPNGLHMLEFWNRSLASVANLDGVEYPGPGPVITPVPVAADGRLEPADDTPFLLVESGIDAVGEPIVTRGEWTLLRRSGPLRLRTMTTGLYSDGWARPDSSYSEFSGPGARAGELTVVVSRSGWCGPDVASSFTVTVGRLAVRGGVPAIGERLSVYRRRLPSCREIAPVVVPNVAPPFRAEVHVDGTFVPAELDPNQADRRELGAQVSFGFVTD